MTSKMIRIDCDDSLLWEIPFDHWRRSLKGAVDWMTGEPLSRPLPEPPVWTSAPPPLDPLALLMREWYGANE